MWVLNKTNHPTMDLLECFNSSTALVLGFVLCFFYLLGKSRGRKIKLLPPEVAGGWPIIGHLPLLSGRELPHIVLGALAEKYGSIYRIRLGMKSTVVVSSSEIAKELFTTNDIATASRPKLVAIEIMGYNSATFGFAPYGPYWRQVRKMATLELLSTHRIELQKHMRFMEVVSWLKELHKCCSGSGSGSGHVMVDMKKWFEDLTRNMIMKIVVGKRSFGAGAEGDEDEAKQCRKVTRDIMRLFAVFAMRDAVPFLGWLDLGGHEKAMKKVAKEWDDLLSKWLEEHKMMKGAKDQEKDFMDVMLSLLQGRNIGGFDADVINKATCLTMIVGAGDTSSTTLTWAICLLLNNRNALKKVQEELDINVGKGRLVQESDITNLVYLQAVVKETLRLYPPPLAGPREVTEDCSIGGYHVPKGTRLIMNIWKIQTDPKVWIEPLKFIPERFLNTHKHLEVSGGHDYEYIPFGGGRRGCPGMAFAMQLVPFAIASLVHAFDLSTPSDALVDMTGSVGLTNEKETPLEVIISPRLSPAIYESY